MSKRIEFEGSVHEFPDDFSDADIAKALQSAHPTPAPQSGSWLGSMASNLWNEVNPIGQIKSLANATAHPIDTIQSIGQAHADVAKKAEDSFKRGDYAEGVRHAIGYLLPVLGPALDARGDQAQRGDVGGAVGGTLGMAANLLGPAAAAKYAPSAIKAIPSAIRNLNNPVEEAALQSVEGKVPMSVGQRTGSRGLQRVEQQLENFPGSSSQAQKFYANQQDALASEGQRLAAQPSPVQTNEVGAGRAILEDRLPDRINKMKSRANQLYDELRSVAAANKQTVQVGTKATGILDASGNPVTVPVTKTLETPVDLGPFRQQLEPLYNDLTSLMPIARRDASPAYADLKKLMENPQQQMDAMDFDRTLGAIKSIARDGANPYLTSQSQRVAKQVVAAGEKELQNALGTAGPDVQAKLRTARNMVKGYHDTGELLASLNDEPAALYKNLTTGGDKAFGTLQELSKVAPQQVKTVARTFLEGLMQKATNEGGFARGAGIMQDWNRLGPEAKKLLFGEQLTNDLDNFLLAAKRLTTQTNPSGSAHGIAALHGTAAVGTAITGALTGNVPLAAGAIGEAFIAPKVAAQLLLTPGGARLLTKGLTVPVNTPQFQSTMDAIGALTRANQALPQNPKQ